MDGWVRLHRKIMNHAVFSDPRIFRLFTICLMKATYVERSVAVGNQKIDLRPGQFVSGRNSLADDYNEGLQKQVDKVDARTVWRWIKRLETWGCLSSNSSNKFSIITIVNWAEYQDSSSEVVQQIDHVNVQVVSSTCPADVQHVSTNKKEISKEDKKEISKDKKIPLTEFVHMTQVEYDTLIQKIGEERTQTYIERLDNYKGAKGKQYKSDYRAILTWVSKDKENPKLNGDNARGNIRTADKRLRSKGRSQLQAEGTWSEIESKFFR